VEKKCVANVLLVYSLPAALISPAKKARDLAKICNLHRNLPFLPSPKIGLVIYIILNLAGVLYATLTKNAFFWQGKRRYTYNDTF
jgi:hypothetical protein